MANRVDFSANSKIYDRRHGAVISDQLVADLVNYLPQGATVLDIGAGTGRIAVALAPLGFQVIAIDPAVSMLQTMRQKPGATRVLPVAAEGPHLPLRKDCADAVVLARLLYLVPDWKAMLREAMEVLKPGGTLFHEWGNGHDGEAWVQIRERARWLFQDAGVEVPFHPGAQTESEVDSYLLSLGCFRRQDIMAGAGPETTLADFLNKIESGEVSYIWSVPTDVRKACLPELRRWCEATIDLKQTASIPAELRWVVYEKVG